MTETARTIILFLAGAVALSWRSYRWLPVWPLNTTSTQSTSHNRGLAPHQRVQHQAPAI